MEESGVEKSYTFDQIKVLSDAGDNQAAKLLAWSQVGRAQGHDALMEPRTANTHGRPLLKRGGSWSKEMSKRRPAPSPPAEAVAVPSANRTPKWAPR